MKPVIPAQALQQHLAILGKTGSGKTSTAKLAVEQVAGEDARVIVLDPIKSDWWGLTSSADGKRPGLPFHILGGPHGHVPLHAAAGKAIGELVGRGDLRQAIIDMADFEPGGQLRFFVDFAPALLRSMRGVVYLVIEEAHLFAPKERSGMGSEQLAIHWAKTIATAGRSKGIRLMVLSQRTQALHNAVLGSCDTLIAHRFTAPADQEPVLKWLKANVDAEVYREVAESLSSLRTGEGWICSGEAQIFERRQFPRIHTYDNSATPTDDEHRAEVATAPVDREALRAILGAAVKEAEGDDPKALRARIAELEAELEHRDGLPEEVGNAFLEEAEQRGYARGRAEAAEAFSTLGTAVAAAAGTMCRSIQDSIDARLGGLAGDAPKIELPGYGNVVVHESNTPAVLADRAVPIRDQSGTKSVQPSKPGDASIGNSGKRRMLIALAQHRSGLTGAKLSILTDIARSGGTWRIYLKELRGAGYVDGEDPFRITPAGLKALGPYKPLPTGSELREYWRARLGGKKRAIFDAVVKAYPNAISATRVASEADIAMTGGTWRIYCTELRNLELITGKQEMRASPNLFE